MSFLTTVGLLGLAASPATAFWRLPCVDTLVVERADPIVDPGKVSGHVHQIMGGNGFDFSMTYNDTQASECSSCTVKGDYSNYWTPTLYYAAEDGTFESVDQVGGGLVYYLQRQGPNNDQLKAFPEGFRMVAGNPFKRSGGSDFASQAVSYNCLDYNAAAKPETGGFPNYNCPDGLRSQLFFPACWDGVNLDSPDHESHMSYPIGAYNDGACPSSHPVHLISIFFEVIWDTNKFADRWYGNGQPFVWSMGDPTGYGFHGDFINGWDVSLLQKAVDECTNLSGMVEDCPVFTLWPDSTAEGCKKGSQVNEVISGVLNQLPGCNPVQNGPGAATPQTTCTGNITNSISAAKTTFQDLTSSGWSYQGCGTDNFYNRALTGATYSSNDMTNAACAAFCASKGFSMAGTEYSTQCYCANDVPSWAAPLAGVMGDCSMPCAGDNTNATMCGGAAALSLYKKCDTGSACTNIASNTDGSSGSGSDSGSGSGSGYAPPAGSSSSAVPSSNGGAANQVQAPSSQSSGSSNPGSANSPASPAPGAQSTKVCKPKKPASSAAAAAAAAATSSASYTSPVAPAANADSSVPSDASSSSSVPAAPASASASASSTGSSVPSASSSSAPAPSVNGSDTVAPGDIKLPAGWTYSSCVTDSVRPRSLQKLAPYTLNGTLVTSTNCVDYCDLNGFVLAATEYGGECFCGNTLTNSTKADESQCNIACKGGDHNEICGGSAVMNLYNKGAIVTGSGSSNGTYKMLKRDHLHKHILKSRIY